MATVRMPSSLHAQMTRRAISPRFAIRIFLNMKSASGSEKDSGSLAAVGRGQQTNKKARLGAPPQRLPVSLLRPYGKQLLPVFNRLAVRPHLLYDFASHVRLNLVQQLHGLDNTQYLPGLNRVPHLDERRSARRGRFVQ